MATEEGMQSTKPSTFQANAYPPDIRVKVGGLWFSLDSETCHKLDSPLLRAIIHVDSRHIDATKMKAAEVAVDEADHECFTSFVLMTRYDTLPVSVFSSKEKRDKLLKEASFWGIRHYVEEALREAALAVKESLLDQPICIEPQSKDVSRDTTACFEHHNHRKSDNKDISFGSFCTKCTYAENKVVFLEGEVYTHCIRCHCEVLYKANLMWCHKCCCCVDCQRAGSCDAGAIPSIVSSSASTLFTQVEERLSSLRDKL